MGGSTEKKCYGLLLLAASPFVHPLPCSVHWTYLSRASVPWYKSTGKCWHLLGLNVAATPQLPAVPLPA